MDITCLQRGNYTILEFFHIVRKHDDSGQAFVKKCQNPESWQPRWPRLSAVLSGWGSRWIHELCTASWRWIFFFFLFFYFFKNLYEELGNILKCSQDLMKKKVKDNLKTWQRMTPSLILNWLHHNNKAGSLQVQDETVLSVSFLPF